MLELSVVFCKQCYLEGDPGLMTIPMRPVDLHKAQRNHSEDWSGISKLHPETAGLCLQFPREGAA